jgi:hypothetical protein
VSNCQHKCVPCACDEPSGLVVCAVPDDTPDTDDGVYVGYGYLALLLDRANRTSATHCTTCTCTEL